jgi:hypothetical protein
MTPVVGPALRPLGHRRDPGRFAGDLLQQTVPAPGAGFPALLRAANQGLSRDQPKPGRKVATARELLHRWRKGLNGQSADRPHTRQGLKAAGCPAFPCNRVDPLFLGRDRGPGGAAFACKARPLAFSRPSTTGRLGPLRRQMKRRRSAMQGISRPVQSGLGSGLPRGSRLREAQRRRCLRASPVRRCGPRPEGGSAACRSRAAPCPMWRIALLPGTGAELWAMRPPVSTGS